MQERQAVAAATAARYQRARKKERSQILEEFTKLTGYDRSYASWLLRGHGKKLYGPKRRLVGEARSGGRASRAPYYDEKVRQALRRVWVILDCICGKRLAAIMKEVVPRLECFNELKCDGETRDKLLRISAATIDRLLASERQKYQLRGRSRTKPGTLLKKQIPLRTFSEWNEQMPGFVEVDLVAHEGGLAVGDYLSTLTMTDVYSGWTEVQAVQNKAQVWVFAALKEMRTRLPFTLRGIDSDNGSEFINADLLQYCQQEKLTFTRSRPYRKNDNCYVEQKNYTIVRRHVGYQRMVGPQQQLLLNELYGHLRLYANYFQPVMKLKSKARTGSQVKKTYHEAQTPYQKLRQDPHLTKAQQQRLTAGYSSLNPAALKRQIERLQSKLLKLSQSAKPARSPRSNLSDWSKGQFKYGKVE